MNAAETCKAGANGHRLAERASTPAMKAIISQSYKSGQAEFASMGSRHWDRDSADQRWCILRTSGGRTLAVARSLADAGLDVWTPVQTMTKRRGRSRERISYDAPIMPTFVFARAHHLPDLVEMMAAPASPHPRFSIFRYLGSVPLIADSEVAGARRVEDRSRKAALVGTRKSFLVGQSVRVGEGPAAGLSGQVVADGEGKFVLVAFGTVTLKIGAWLLGKHEVQSADIAA